MEILLQPPKGSYFYVFAKSHNLDDTCPKWTPTKVCEKEVEHLEFIKSMQKHIKECMARCNRRLSHILQVVFGKWNDDEYIKVCSIVALNALDLGYPDDHNACHCRDQSVTSRH